MAEAIAEEREAVKLAPDSANIQAGLGLTLIKAGQNQEGGKSMRQPCAWPLGTP